MTGVQTCALPIFLTSVKQDLFPDVISAFTPKGEVRELLKGSTCIDFAFNVHTEIGKSTVGCRVNGREVPLDYTLRNGDAVEIRTSKEQTPQREWLRFAKTPKARARIKEWLRSKERERSVEFGRELLLDTFRRYGTDPKILDKEDEFKELMNTGGFAQCGWDGDSLTEAAIKNETKATVRCILDEQPAGLKCIYSGKPARRRVIFAKAY